VHISAIKLPEGVRPTTTDRDFTVATIVGRSAEEPVAGAPTAEAAVPGAEGAEAATAEAAEDKEKPKEETKKKKE
jgi:large subunit ribosomal protein L25